MLNFGIPLPIQETKSRKDHWEVSGYLSTYNDVDMGNDVVMPGAFDRWLRSGNKTRFLYSHRPDKVLGVYQELKSDGKGLFARAKISQTPLGEEVYTLVKDGAVDSFSIGYITVDHDRKDGMRRLKDLDLPESSLVAMPLNPDAVVTAWKHWLSLFDVDTDEQTTLADKAKYLNEGLTELLTDIRGLVDGIDRPLSQTKRRELTDLLDCVSEMDAVRSELKSVLITAPTSTGMVEARRLHYELAEKRKRLAHILGETS